MAEHRFEREEVEEVRQVDQHLQRRFAPRVDALAGAGEPLQVGAVVGAVAGVALQFLVDVLAEAAVVEVAVLAAEAALQELAVEGLAQDVEPERLAVEFDERVRDARRGQPGGGEDAVADPFVQPGAVLRAVVEVELLQPEEARVAAGLAEVHREARPLVDLLVAAGRALELDADGGELLAVEAQRGGRVLAAVLAQLLPLVGGEVDAHAHDRLPPEERLRRVVGGRLLLRRRGSGGEAQGEDGGGAGHGGGAR